MSDTTSAETAISRSLGHRLAEEFFLYTEPLANGDINSEHFDRDAHHQVKVELLPRLAEMNDRDRTEFWARAVQLICPDPSDPLGQVAAIEMTPEGYAAEDRRLRRLNYQLRTEESGRDPVILRLYLHFDAMMHSFTFGDVSIFSAERTLLAMGLTAEERAEKISALRAAPATQLETTRIHDLFA